MQNICTTQRNINRPKDTAGLSIKLSINMTALILMEGTGYKRLVLFCTWGWTRIGSVVLYNKAFGKLFGDALRANSIKMGNDQIESVAFFKNCKQLFDAYGVPHSLKAILIRPFLNERARSYLAKLDTVVSGDYDTLKEALLRDFKLSPNVYLQRFNKCVKTSDDMYRL